VNYSTPISRPLVLLVLLLSSCTGVPDGITPVNNFEVERYLGQWYEIARLDHAFERNLIKVTADYSLKGDGSISVTNRGFDNKKQHWETAKGKAYFVQDEKIAHLKVSFFGPFYGSYIVFELDDNYQYAFVTSSSKQYLWLLSRSKEIKPELKERFLAQIKSLGFATDQIIFVEQ